MVYFRIQEIKEKVRISNEELQQVDMDLDENQGIMVIVKFIIWLSLFSRHGARWFFAERSGKKRIAHALPALLEGNTLFSAPVSFGCKISELI